MVLGYGERVIRSHFHLSGLMLKSRNVFVAIDLFILQLAFQPLNKIIFSQLYCTYVWLISKNPLQFLICWTQPNSIYRYHWCSDAFSMQSKVSQFICINDISGRFDQLSDANALQVVAITCSALQPPQFTMQSELKCRRWLRFFFRSSLFIRYFVYTQKTKSAVGCNNRYGNPFVLCVWIRPVE